MLTRPVEEEVEVEQVLNDREIIRAATNHPDLADDFIVLGTEPNTRTFPIVDLPYDDYTRFLVLLQPVIQLAAGKLASITGMQITSPINIMDVIKECADSLPELATIVCQQSDRTISIEDVKVLGKTPFKLAEVVIKQIERNRMIGDISDFFVQILPLMRTPQAKEVVEKKKRQYRTKATLS